MQPRHLYPITFLDKMARSPGTSALDYDRLFENVYFDQTNQISYMEPQQGMNSIPPNYYSFYSINFVLEDLTLPSNHSIFACNKLIEMLDALVALNKSKLPRFVFTLDKVEVDDYIGDFLNFLNQKMGLIAKIEGLWARSANQGMTLAAFRLYMRIMELLFEQELITILNILPFSGDFSSRLKDSHKISDVQREALKNSGATAVMNLIQVIYITGY